LLTHDLSARAAPPPNAKAVAPTDRLVPNEIQAWDDGAFAGLPPGSHPEVLTWEHAFTLALVRCRTPRPAGERALAESLDPKVLAEQARGLGIDDFERFRKDFFAERSDGETFADPSGSLFDLLRRLQTIENARKFVEALEELKAASQALPTPPRLDRLDSWLQKARRRFLDELRAYRDRLGEVKVELGLSPHAPVVPDRTSLARFRAVYEKADDWFRNPERNPAELPTLVAELPRLGNVILGHIALNGVSEGDPNRREEVLRAAEQTAIKNRGQDDLDNEVRQRVRRRISHLLEVRTAYQRERQRLLLSLRTKDQVFEQMMAPPPPGVTVKVPDLIALHAHVLESENRLVELWASFHAERLALARDLRLLPGHDWKSFLAQIQGEPTAA
jgi:hypothetical protein